MNSRVVNLPEAASHLKTVCELSLVQFLPLATACLKKASVLALQPRRRGKAKTNMLRLEALQHFSLINVQLGIRSYSDITGDEVDASFCQFVASHKKTSPLYGKSYIHFIKRPQQLVHRQTSRLCISGSSTWRPHKFPNLNIIHARQRVTSPACSPFFISTPRKRSLCHNRWIHHPTLPRLSLSHSHLLSSIIPSHFPSAVSSRPLQPWIANTQVGSLEKACSHFPCFSRPRSIFFTGTCRSFRGFYQKMYRGWEYVRANGSREPEAKSESGGKVMTTS